jgi:hypothetical protein
VFLNYFIDFKGAWSRSPASTQPFADLSYIHEERQMKTFLILLMLSSGVIAQSRDTLKKKYGEPISETFMVRPGIAVTASHDSTGKISELVIAPLVTDLIKSKGNGLTDDVLKKLIDELVPVSARGTPQIGGFLNISCLPANDCYGSYDSYEKLTIYYNAGKNGNVNYAVIKWKK